MILTSQLLEGEYYNYNQIIPTSYNTLVTVDKIQLQENIEFLGLYSKDVKDLTKWNITKDNLEITVNTTESIYKTNNDITFEGNELLIGLNNSYVLDVLKTIEDSRIEIKFKRNIDPVLIETDKEIYLILPIRIIDSQTT
jgi:DNA polymerase-3 subunit beta